MLQVNESETRSSELLKQAADTVDKTHSYETLAARDYHSVTRYVQDLETDTATIDQYNTTAHRVCATSPAVLLLLFESF